jgi:hypothetical protein
MEAKEVKGLMEAYASVYENLSESHFKVGDKVICKDSGMKGEVVKLDKPDGEDDEKYYTVEREDGKKMKYAPNELKSAGKEKNGGASKESETKFHTKLDKLVHKTFGSSPEEKKMKEEVEIEEGKQPFPAKKVAKQMERARKGSVYGRETKNEPTPNPTDAEKKETTRFSKMFHASEKAKREKQEADKERRSPTFYKDTHPASAPKMKKVREEVELDEGRKEPDLDKMKRQENRHQEKAVKQRGGSRGDSKNRAFKMSGIRDALERGEDPRADTYGGARTARGNAPEDHRAGFSKNPLNNPPRRVKEPGVKKEEVETDLFDYILEHLVTEGYADTNEAALAIMANMSEEWRQSIVESDALRNTIKTLEGKRDAMNANKPGSANTAAPGKQSIGAATYKAYQRLRGV